MNFTIKVQFDALNFLLFFNSFVFIVVFAIQILLNLSSISANDFVLLGGLIVDRGDLINFYSLITSTFLHLDLIHFLLNLYALYRLGGIAANYYDDKQLFSTYILGGLGGSLLSVTAYSLAGKDLATLGASGAIFAIFGLLLGGSLRRYRYGVNLPINFWDLLPLVLLSLSIGLIGDLNINNLAHLGGLLTGIMLGLIYQNTLSPKFSTLGSLVEQAFYYTSIILFSLSYIFLIINLFV